MRRASMTAKRDPKDLSDEADLSAQQDQARPPPRLSRAHGDGGRPQGDRQPPPAGPQAPLGLTPPADSTAPAAVERLRRRPDFLAANSGRRVVTPAAILLVRARGDDGPMRVGFTVTKKIGSSVVRNRLKRRLRAAARDLLPAHGVAHADHVLIGRADGLTRTFALLRDDLARALAKVAR
jgi:ribonuclease P protein component